MKKRVFSLLLSCVMMVGLLPMSVFATGTETTSTSPVSVDTQEELNDAITNATGPTIINLTSGQYYDMPGSLANKNITISGSKSATVKMLSAVNATGSTIAFEGVTVMFDNDNYEGLQHATKVTYTNCTIEGTQFLYAPEVAFSNCTFKVEGDAYAVWTYGAHKVDFANCTFNTDGKAVLVYTEAAHEATINVTDCTFNATNNRSKAAIEVGQSANGNEANYTLNITNSTADENFVANNSTSNLWGNKNEMDSENLTVAIDATTDANGKYTGGTFNQDVTGSVADGYRVTNNGDGIWTVSKKPSSSGGGGSTTYAITVPSAENGTVTASAKYAARNATVTLTVTPADGYVLDTLTVTDKDGKEITLTQGEDGKYTFKMPASKVTISVSFQAEEPPVPCTHFDDVGTDDWFYDAVEYVFHNGIMNGTGETTFAPGASTTRAMVWTMLARLSGETISGTDWADQARTWAMAAEVSDGTNGDGEVTREQLATMLYRFAGLKGYDQSAQGDLSKFLDGASVSDWASAAMVWANGAGIITGDDQSKVNPLNNATRAEVAAMFMRFCENIVN